MTLFMRGLKVGTQADRMPIVHSKVDVIKPPRSLSKHISAGRKLDARSGELRTRRVCRADCFCVDQPTDARNACAALFLVATTCFIGRLDNSPCADAEHDTERSLLGSRYLQLPYQWHRQRQDHEIGNDVENPSGDNDRLKVDACASYRGVP